MIQPYLHGANIDLKGFDDKRHRRVCGAKLQPVLDSIDLMKKLGIWLEVTTLVIPGHNDSDNELQQMALFLKHVGPEIPWHLSAFFPAYKMLRQRPPAVKLCCARGISVKRQGFVTFIAEIFQASSTKTHTVITAGRH